MSLLSRVSKSAPPQPYRMYLYAQEKFGKTSWAAFAPKPIFLMTQGETGLLDLIDFGQVPETAHLPPSAENPNGFTDWLDLEAAVRAVADEPHDYQTLVIDTANGAERMLAQHVLAADFQGKKVGKGSYSDYGKGDQACVGYWTDFLRLLDAVRTARRMNVVLLAHSQIKSVNNPEGSDYDQLRPDGINKLWPLTHKWASVIAAGTYALTVKDDKVTGGHDRILRVRGTAAVVAGNRYGMPDTIPCGNDPRAAYGHFARALTFARAKGPAPHLSKEQFKELMDRKGWAWGKVLVAIDRSQGTAFAPEKAGYDDVPPNVLLDFAAYLRGLADRGGTPPADPPTRDFHGTAEPATETTDDDSPASPPADDAHPDAQ
jgi:hypothetical protein